MSAETPARPGRRWVIVAQTQLPILATFALLGAVTVGLDVRPAVPLLAIIGYALVAAATGVVLVAPFGRSSFARQALIAVVDLLAAVCIALALYEHVHAIAALSAFPAMWLAIMGGRIGTIVALVGVYIAALAPLLLARDAVTPGDWASGLLIAIVIPVGVIVTRLLVATNRTVQNLLLDAQVRVATNDKQIERLGAVLQSYAESADIGLIVFDENGHSLITNSRSRDFARLAQYDPSTGDAEHIYTADRVTPVPAELQPIGRVLRGEAIDGELFWIGRPGRQRALIATGLPLRSQNGTDLGTMFIAHDITGQLRRGREREDALSTLSHELRTPLNAIIGYADLLASDPLPDVSRSRVEVISRNADRLLTLSHRFLDDLQGPRELDLVDIDLAAAIADAADPRTLPELAERRVTVSVPADLHVHADRAGLLAILGNLVSNAVKYSHPGDEVRITADADADGVRTTVFNTGSRLERHDLERVFDRYYRAEHARETAIPGTGIGLAVSRAVAGAHGGTLTAEDTAEGASFTLRLPA